MEQTLAQRQSTEASLLPFLGLSVLVGLNLRPSLAVVGPLTDYLRAELAMNYTMISLLTLLPVLVMGLGCFVAMPLARRFGIGRLIGLALGLIAIADLLRLFEIGWLAFLCTALLAGVGIALIQALMPAIIKQRSGFRMALGMGCYITAVMCGAAISASLSPMLVDTLGNWRHSMAVWGVLAGVAWLFWQVNQEALALAAGDGIVKAGTRLAPSRRRVLATFFSLAGAGYVCMLAWLPPYTMDLGFSAVEAGYLLGYLTCIEVVAGLLFPALAQGSNDRRPVVYLVLALTLIGFVVLALMPQRFSILLPLTLLGLGIGGQFPMALIVAMDHHPDPQVAGQIVGHVQGIGYTLAAFTPLIAGISRDLLGTFSDIWLVLAVVYVLLLALASVFDPRQYQRLFN